MTPFTQAREAFDHLRVALTTGADLARDVEQSFDRLLTRFSTKIFENRFIVGGVAERIVAAVFVAMGEDSKRVGVSVSRTDIHVGGAKFSVKCSFQASPTTIRLINVMGDSPSAEWNEPTIFVISGRGIGYADPELLPGATARRKDVLELKFRSLLQLWDRSPDLLIPLAIPVAQCDVSRSDIASRLVADEILRYTKLLRPFDTRTHVD